MRLFSIAIFSLILDCSALAMPATETFEVRSQGGTKISGEVDVPDGPSRATIVLVAGTGPFDRDVTFGSSGTDADKIFRTLAMAFTQNGITVVRFDKRGIGFNPQSRLPVIDRQLVMTTSVDTQVEDLRAVIDFAKG